MLKIYKVLSITIITLLVGCGDNSTTTIDNNKDARDIYLIGSSTMELLAPSFTLLASKQNLIVHNFAKGGEQLHSICLRVAGLSGHVKFKNTNLKSDTKNYIDADWPLDYALKTFDVKINNIVGKLAVDQKGYYFTPEQNAEIDTTQAFEVIPILPPIKENAIFIVNLGKNNLLSNNTDINNLEYIIDKSELCITNIQKTLTKNIISVGFFTSTDANENLINNVIKLNKHYENSHVFFDINQYLNSKDIWSDTHIHPTQQDLDQQMISQLPISLSRDSIHVNEKTNNAISVKLLQFINSKSG